MDGEGGGGGVKYSSFNVARQKVVEKLHLISFKLAPIHVIYTPVFLLTFVNVMDNKQTLNIKTNIYFKYFPLEELKAPDKFSYIYNDKLAYAVFWETNERIF